MLQIVVVAGPYYVEVCSDADIPVQNRTIPPINTKPVTGLP